MQKKNNTFQKKWSNNVCVNRIHRKWIIAWMRVSSMKLHITNTHTHTHGTLCTRFHTHTSTAHNYTGGKIVIYMFTVLPIRSLYSFTLAKYKNIVLFFSSLDKSILRHRCNCLNDEGNHTRETERAREKKKPLLDTKLGQII